MIQTPPVCSRKKPIIASTGVSTKTSDSKSMESRENGKTTNTNIQKSIRRRGVPAEWNLMKRFMAKAIATF